MHSFMNNPVIQNLKAVKTPELKAAISTLLCNATCSPFLLCSICHDIPRRPIRPKKCAHVMCVPCLQQFVKSNCNIKNLQCPRCRIEFDPTDPAQIISVLSDPFGRCTYGQIQLTCPNGCGHRYTAAGLHHHQVHDCAQRIVLCPFGCGEQVKWCELGSDHVPRCHKAYERCNHCTLPIQRNSGGHICLHRAVETIRRMLSLHKYFKFK
ncbi:MAG: hypothetical protein FD143_3536 [Ignavibacteria bacterium]|nr:MAG: hypothetical protein FD143_3536 [Ignavibacteria bacterium]